MHFLVITFVALIVLGPEKLPHALRQVGKTMGEVRRWSDTISSEVRGALALDLDDPPPAATPPAPASAAASIAGDPSRQRPSPLQEGGEWH